MAESKKQSTALVAPHFSVVTVCLNSASTIQDTVKSVRNQRGVTVEHIIKDGGSHDSTLAIVRETNPEVKVIEKTDSGIYDAMNQGFIEGRGEFVSFLNSDDYYPKEDVLSSVLEVFRETSADLVFGDIEMIDVVGNVRRTWRGNDLKFGSLGGMQMPHPAVFIRRDLYSRDDLPFDPTYRISADIKQQLDLVEHRKVETQYIPKNLVYMRTGGASTRDLKAMVSGWLESSRAYREVHHKSGIFFVARKVSKKILQVIPRNLDVRS